MISHDHILTILKGSTSQQPMSKSTILLKSGLSESELNIALTEMYALGKVGKCTHTKLGVTDEVYWPTGMCKIVPDYGRNFTDSPLHREAIIKEKTMPEDQANTTSIQANVPTCLRLLTHIETHPNCPYSDFTDKLKIEGASAFLGNHIKRGDVIKTQVGPRKFNYSLIAGKTAKQIYNNGAKNQAFRARPSTQAPEKIELVEGSGQKNLNNTDNTSSAVTYIVADIQSEIKKLNDSNVPAFLRKPDDEFAVADSLDEKLGAEAILPLVMNINTPDANSFRRSQRQILTDAPKSASQEMREHILSFKEKTDQNGQSYISTSIGELDHYADEDDPMPKNDDFKIALTSNKTL